MWLYVLHLATPQRKRGGLRPPPTRNTRRYSPISPVSDPERILKDAKAKQKLASSSGKSVKTQAKYVSKDQVHKFELKQKQISDSPVSVSEKSSSDLHFQSSVDSVNEYFQAQTEVDLIENLSEFGGEITQFSSEPKSHIVSPSSQSIFSEVSSFVEEK